MRAVFASILALACVSCESQPAVIRVGNDVIEKASLEGDWYSLQTVVDTPFSIPYTFVGEQSLLERVSWEVQERRLIARRSYEYVLGSEGEGIAGEVAVQGAPIAVHAIESHFDIRREYNAVTGEEINVIVENTTDRPWNEREYMRVDWSQNLITEGEFLSYARIFDGVELEPAAYTINDPAHPDAPRFSRDEEGTLQYFDVVTRVFARPTTIDIEGWDYPTCWLEYQTHVDCAPAEIGVRHSYMRADPDRDYQPLDYTGDRMERFGYFYTERAGYDPHYGAVEPARSHWINRHNLWMQSHRLDGEERVRCTTDEECDDGRGSVCDMQWARAHQEREGLCTIAYRDREVKPIVYYASLGFPEDLLQTAEGMVDEWNETFVETVGSLRVNECISRGDSDCDAERDRESRMFLLCSNPVVEGDDPECGPPGTEARIGDLRYSLLAWVPEPHEGSPLGYGPSSADPLTGELVQANAFMYGAGVETLASYARDLVALLNGDLTEDEVLGGEHVERWVREQTAPGSRTIPLDAQAVERIASAIDMTRITSRREGTRSPELRQRFDAAMQSLSRRDAFGRPGVARAHMDAVRGTPLESMLVGPDLQTAAGIDPALAGDDALLEASSPLRGLSLSRLRAIERARRALRRDRCVIRAADFADEGLLGLAREVQREAAGDGTMEWYGQTFTIGSGGEIDYEAVRTMFRHPIFHSTGAHEIGHTLGLRHNFAGSYDALNYRPEYWALRDDGSMGPRLSDPITEEEIDGRELEYRYSTVMDYGNNFVVTDAAGLGHYDHAAIKMGYGDLVEVFTEAPDSLELGWIYFQQLFGWPGLTYNSFFEGEPIETYHYTAVPALAGGVDALEARADVPYTSLVAEPTLESDDFIDMPLVDAEGRPAVPYRFCTDELSDLGADCMLYDAGADDYESLSSVIDTYWSYYVFESFRRERLGFDIWDHYDRVYWRYFSKLQSANQSYVLNRAFIEELFPGDPSLDTFWTDEDGYGTQTAAVEAAFMLFTRVATAPEPGGYVAYTRADGSDAYLLDDFSVPDFEVDAVDGRFLETSWDFDAGYYWLDQLDRVGFFIDKILAIQTLLDPETNFLGKDTDADVRAFQINFASNFPEATTAFLRAVLTENYAAIGPRRVGRDIVYPDPLEIIDGSAGGVPIDPNTDFSVQLYAATFGIGLIPATYDDVFFEQSRIFIDGAQESVILPAGERVEYTDPFTSLTYVAGTYPDDALIEQGTGAQILLHARAIEAGGDLYELDRYLDLIRYVRSLSWYYDHGP
jgi:hypothetical protein